MNGIVDPNWDVCLDYINGNLSYLGSSLFREKLDSLPEIQQEWFTSLLERSRVDLMRLTEAVVNTSAAQTVADSEDPETASPLHTTNQ